MVNNKLVLNSDKTHVLVLASAQKHRKHGNFGIQLDTGNETIEPVEDEFLLGANLSNNFLWNQHIRDGSKALVTSLSRKNTALAKISNISDFKTQKMIGSSLITSTLSYIIQVYSSCSEYLINALQVQQNNAARSITKLPFMTPTKILLNQCDWLSVRQMSIYFSLTLLHKVVHERTPKYLADRVKQVSRLRETRSTDHLCLESIMFKTVGALFQGLSLSGTTFQLVFVTLKTQIDYKKS